MWPGGLAWGHRAEDGGGQVADVDAHLQGGGAREQVRVPGLAGVRVVDAGLRGRCLELDLHPLAVGALEQAGVLCGEDALQVAARVELAEVVAGGGGVGSVGPGAGGRQAGHAGPRRDLAGCDEAAGPTPVAAHALAVAGQPEGTLVEAPDPFPRLALGLQEQPRTGQAG